MSKNNTHLGNKEYVMRLAFTFQSLFLLLWITGSFVKSIYKRMTTRKKVHTGPEISACIQGVQKTTKNDTSGEHVSGNS